MGELVTRSAGRKRDWSLTRPALLRLLEWLDAGEDSRGERYEEMRRRLVSYFDRKGCAAPDGLADETLNRVARRLEEEGSIETEAPAKFCYTIARYVFMEHLRSAERVAVALEDAPRRGDFAAPEADGGHEVRERMLDCLERCTSGLDPASRDIITRYYAAGGKAAGRHKLAEELGLSFNALCVRACRIRARLEACVSECAGVGPV